MDLGDRTQQRKKINGLVDKSIKIIQIKLKEGGKKVKKDRESEFFGTITIMA